MGSSVNRHFSGKQSGRMYENAKYAYPFDSASLPPAIYGKEITRKVYRDMNGTRIWIL